MQQEGLDLDICRTGGQRSDDLRDSVVCRKFQSIITSCLSNELVRGKLTAALASFWLVIKSSDLLTPEAELQEWLMRLVLVWMQVLWLQTPMCSAGPMAAAPQHLVPTALEAAEDLWSPTAGRLQRR